MSVTWAVLKLPTLPLKEAAKLNISRIVVTDDVSHKSKSLLKEEAPENKNAMDVTDDTSHAEIS